MSQKLIQPINNMILSAGFLNENYEKKFGFKHYGVDCYGYGNDTIYCQGDGIILRTCLDKTYGNCATVLYREVFDVEDKRIGDIIVNYFHMKSLLSNTSKGAIYCNKDTRLGIIGMTGSNVTGVHLHYEAHLVANSYISGFSTTNFNKTDAWIDPLSFTHTKYSTPDFQFKQVPNSVYNNKKYMQEYKVR